MRGLAEAGGGVGVFGVALPRAVCLSEDVEWFAEFVVGDGVAVDVELPIRPAKHLPRQ